jgi:hydrogenase nickel incorporation protein HypA/HybF
MHERSLVKALIAQVASLASAQQASRVMDVRVRIGPLSGVEPLLLSGAFADLANADLFEGTTLTVFEVPLRAQCRTCHAVFNVEAFHFRCDVCGSQDIETIDGDAVILESVEFALAAKEEPAYGDGL